MDAAAHAKAKKAWRLIQKSQAVKGALLQKQAKEKERLARPPAAPPSQDKRRRGTQAQGQYRNDRHDKHLHRLDATRKDVRAKAAAAAAVAAPQEPVVPSARELRSQLDGLVDDRVVAGVVLSREDMPAWQRRNLERVTEVADRLQACHHAGTIGSRYACLRVYACVQVVRACEAQEAAINEQRQREAQQQPGRSRGRAVFRDDFRGELPTARSMGFGSSTSGRKRLDPLPHFVPK
jgi:hypothetical protein|tara:strand:- start:71 stop:778 length:708 start_codon:yes stop_codon:yes gene_type:complete